MNTKDLLPKRRLQRRSRWFWPGVAAAVVIIVAIAVPLGIILPKRNRPPGASIILPLYVYPHNNTTWKPVYDA